MTDTPTPTPHLHTDHAAHLVIWLEACRNVLGWFEPASDLGHRPGSGHRQFLVACNQLDADHVDALGKVPHPELSCHVAAFVLWRDEGVEALEAEIRAAKAMLDEIEVDSDGS